MVSFFLKVANTREVGAYVTLSHCVSLLLSVSPSIVRCLSPEEYGPN